MGFIYKITNKINNKIYIGFTQKTIEDRWRSHIKTAYDITSKDYNALFKKAIRKYGADNFFIEEIDNGETLEELKQKEIYWIRYFNSYAFDKNGYGYNSTRGGDSPFELLQIPIHKIDIMTGSILESYNSISEAEKIYGRGIQEIINKETHPTIKTYTWIPQNEVFNKEQYWIANNYICQLDLKGHLIKIWSGPTEASKILNIAQGNISSCLTNVRTKAGEFQWCYYKDLKQKLNTPWKESNKAHNKKSVDQYDLANNFIKTWESASEAARILNLQNSKITAVCRGTRKTTGGFKWKYHVD